MDFEDYNVRGKKISSMHNPCFIFIHVMHSTIHMYTECYKIVQSVLKFPNNVLAPVYYVKLSVDFTSSLFIIFDIK